MARGYKTGGRQKGVPNKDHAAIRDMIIGALNQVGGMDYLAERAIDSPAAFLTLVGKVLPTQLVGDPDNPVTYVIRGPSPVESTAQWLKLHAPPTIDAESNADVD
jgi:hypothetical protein